VAVGLAAGHLVAGMLAGVGGLLATMAVTANAVTAAGQPPSGTGVSELSATLRQIAEAVRSGTPARPQALPSEPSLRPFTDAVRSVADALDGMPPQRRPSLFAWNTRAQ
jgi:hypothetical protein